MLYIELLGRNPERDLPADVDWCADKYLLGENLDAVLMTDFAKAAILDIDKSVVVGPHLIDSPVLGPIPPEYLSGGVLTLLAAKHLTDRRVHLARVGKNVYPWFIRASESQDIHIVSDYPRFGPELNFRCVIENTGEIAESAIVMWDIYRRLCREGKL